MMKMGYLSQNYPLSVCLSRQTVFHFTVRLSLQKCDLVSFLASVLHLLNIGYIWKKILGEA